MVCRGFRVGFGWYKKKTVGRIFIVWYALRSLRSLFFAFLAYILIIFGSLFFAFLAHILIIFGSLLLSQ